MRRAPVFHRNQAPHGCASCNHFDSHYETGIAHDLGECELKQSAPRPAPAVDYGPGVVWYLGTCPKWEGIKD